MLALLDAAQIANGRLNTVTDLLEHPQLAHRWTEVDSPVGPLRALPPPISLGGTAPALGAVPALGEHTDAILAELGLSDAEISALDGAGAALMSTVSGGWNHAPVRNSEFDRFTDGKRCR